MRRLVINLERSVDRLALMDEQFKAMGVSFERVEAVNAKGNPDLPSGGKWKNLRRNEIGCFLSHYKCWKLIAEGDDDCGAVFEDDVIFSDLARHALSDDFEWPHEWQVLKLETYEVAVRMRRRIVAHFGKGCDVVELLSTHIGGAAYIISKQAAIDLVELFERSAIVEQVDNFIFADHSEFFRTHKVLQTVPALAIQQNFLVEEDDVMQSTIGYGFAMKRRAPRMERIQRELRSAVSKIIDGCFPRYSRRIKVPFQGDLLIK